MANTYTQLFLQIVLAVRGRQSLIPKEHRETLQKYMTAVIQNDKHKLLSIFCMPDHTHILVGLNPDISISSMVLDVKRASTNFINDNHLINTHFNWQKVFWGLSYSKKQVRMLLNMSLTKKNITLKKHSGRNTMNFLTYSVLNTMKNICLNFAVNETGLGYAQQLIPGHFLPTDTGDACKTINNYESNHNRRRKASSGKISKGFTKSRPHY